MKYLFIYTLILTMMLLAYPSFAFNKPVVISLQESDQIKNQKKNILKKKPNKSVEFAWIKAINSSVNQLRYIDDAKQYRKEDYWATPDEFFGRGQGDCEDFAIAKYFFLLESGIDSGSVRLAYTRLTEKNGAHMVLLYYTSQDAVPMVLDNISNSIQLATMRKDLLPVFSFDHESMWLMNRDWQGTYAGKASGYHRWRSLLERVIDPAVVP